MVDGKTAILAVADALDNVTFANAIGGGTTASLEKQGSGTLTLNGTNTYTGASILIGGILLVNGSLDAASAVTVDSGPLGGTGSIGGSVTVSAAGNIAPGTSAGTLAIGGGLDVSAMAASTGKLRFELDALAATSDQIAVTGTLTVGVGALGFSDFEFTDLGGLEIGTYTLVTSGGINGGDSLDGADLSGAIGALSGTLAINGNNLVLNVTATSTGYAAWQTANSTAGDLGDDHDNDGVDNGTEYFLGGPNGNTTGFTPVPGVIDTAGTLSVTWPKGAGYSGVYATDFVVETSSTLSGVWVTETLGGNVIDSPTEVKYTFPGGPPYSGKNFARLKVTGP